MKNEAGSRWAALSGVVFFLLFLGSTFLEPTGLRLMSASAEQVKEYYVAQQGSIDALVPLVTLANAFFVWFLVELVSHLKAAEATPGPMSLLAFGSGLLVAAFSVIGVALLALPAEFPREVDALTVRAMALIGEASRNLLIHTSTVWRGLFIAAVSVVVLRRRALPLWVGWVGVVLAIAALLAPLDSVHTPLSEFTDVLGFGSTVAFPFWVLLASISLVIRRGTLQARTSSDA